MPVIQVQSLPPGNRDAIADAASTLAKRVANVLDVPERQVWVIRTPIESGAYVEGECRADVQPESTHPPIATIMAYEGRPPELIRRVLTTIADTLVELLDLEPGNAFVTWTELNRGRIHTGGSVR